MSKKVSNKIQTEYVPLEESLLICYCQKCGILEKGTYEGLNDFRKHLGIRSTERCLEKGQYYEAKTSVTNAGYGIKDTGLYIMSPI